MDWRRFAAYCAIYMFWGASFLAIREIVAVAPPFLAAGVRFTVAGLILYIWTRATGGSNPSPHLTSQQFRSCAALGLIMFTINYGCLFWAEQRVASGYAAIISATIPMWIFLGEWMILHAVVPRPGAVAGVTLGLVGTALVVWPASNAVSAGTGGHGLNIAALALLFGALCWSTGALWSRRLDIPKSPVESAALQMGLGGLILLAFSASSGEFAGFGHVISRWNWRLSLDMAYLIGCASIAAFTAWLYLMNHEPATRVASASYVNPLVAVIIGAVIAGERFTPLQMAGADFVISGVFFTLQGKMAARPKPSKALKVATAEQDA